MEKSTSQPPGAARELPAVLQPAERPHRPRHARRRHLQPRRIELHAAGEGLADGLVAHRHVGDENVHVPLALAAAHGEPLAQRQELGVALHVRHQVEHLAGRERHAAGGAERGHGTLAGFQIPKIYQENRGADPPDRPHAAKNHGVRTSSYEIGHFSRSAPSTCEVLRSRGVLRVAKQYDQLRP